MEGDCIRYKCVGDCEGLSVFVGVMYVDFAEGLSTLPQQLGSSLPRYLSFSLDRYRPGPLSEWHS